MKKIKVDAVVGLAARVCNQHLKTLKLDHNVFSIAGSIRVYCISGDNYALSTLIYLASKLWFNGYQFDAGCIKKLTDDLVSLKARGLIEE